MSIDKIRFKLYELSEDLRQEATRYEDRQKIRMAAALESLRRLTNQIERIKHHENHGNEKK